MRPDVILIGVIAAVLSKLLADECKAWMPWFAKWLIRLAITRLPENQRERYMEEWRSHIDEIPGNTGKIVAAVGFLFAAKRMPSAIVATRPRIVNAECRIEARAELHKGLRLEMRQATWGRLPFGDHCQVELKSGLLLRGRLVFDLGPVVRGKSVVLSIGKVNFSIGEIASCVRIDLDPHRP